MHPEKFLKTGPAGDAHKTALPVGRGGSGPMVPSASAHTSLFPKESRSAHPCLLASWMMCKQQTDRQTTLRRAMPLPIAHSRSADRSGPSGSPEGDGRHAVGLGSTWIYLLCERTVLLRNSKPSTLFTARSDFCWELYTNLLLIFHSWVSRMFRVVDGCRHAGGQAGTCAYSPRRRAKTQRTSGWPTGWDGAARLGRAGIARLTAANRRRGGRSLGVVWLMIVGSSSCHTHSRTKFNQCRWPSLPRLLYVHSGIAPAYISNWCCSHSETSWCHSLVSVVCHSALPHSAPCSLLVSARSTRGSIAPPPVRKPEKYFWT